MCPYFKSLGCCTKFEERGDELLVWGDKTHVWSTQKVSYPGKTANKIGMFLSHIEGGVGFATFFGKLFVYEAMVYGANFETKQNKP